jgi:hypothetical protein
MSTTFNVWTPEGNVLPNTANTWANPNVIYDTNPVILTGNTHVFKMWCSAAIGTHGIYYFESLDGLTNWTPYASNPVVANQIWPKVFKNGGTYYLYTDAVSSQTAINAYTSTDGVAWTSQGAVISVGSAGTWDATEVFQLGVLGQVAGTWYGYYSGTGSTGQNGFEGLVTSPDLLTWTKSPSNPIILVNTTNMAFMQVGSTYYGWSQSLYNNAQLTAAGMTGIFRFSATNPSGPWTELEVSGNPVPTYYMAAPADFLSGNGSNNFAAASAAQVGDPSFATDGISTYLYYSLSVNGANKGINAAKAINTTVAQLVAGYEGVVGAPISGAPQLNLVTLASDPGTGANANPIGGNWTPLATTGAYTSAQRLSNLIQGTTVQSNADSWWNALTWANDQWSQITFGTLAASGGFVGPEMRMNESGAITTYRLNRGGATGTSQNATIQKLVSGTDTVLTTISGLTVNVGDKFLGVVNGSNIYLYWNGFLIGSATDSSIASGAAGLEMFDNSVVSNAAISAWSGGSFQGAVNGISGSLGAAGAGATITFSGSSSGSTTADGSGNYNTGEVLMPFGTYTITPTKSGVTFTPTSQIVTLSGADMSGVNFTSSSGSSAFSVTDSRVSPFGPNNAVTVNGTETYTQTPNCSLRWWFDTSFNHTQCTPEDCRAAGTPVASGTYPLS